MPVPTEGEEEEEGKHAGAFVGHDSLFLLLFFLLLRDDDDFANLIWLRGKRRERRSRRYTIQFSALNVFSPRRFVVVALRPERGQRRKLLFRLLRPSFLREFPPLYFPLDRRKES